MTSQSPTGPTHNLYRTVWRWHFYAGLVVVPFLLMLATTGLIMIYGNSIQTKLGPNIRVTPAQASLNELGSTATAAMPGATLKLLVVRESPDKPPVYVVEKDGVQTLIALDPTAQSVVATIPKSDTWYAWASNIHGKMFMGDVGDMIIEAAAGLGIVLVITGLFLWWPRDAAWTSVLVPRLWLSGRALWKEVHVSTGFYISVIMLFFLLSGLAWTPVWGTKLVQAWSTFPAAKWDAVPLSDEKHAKMNHAQHKEVPWALEQTPLPVSGSEAGITGLAEGQAATLDSIAALARQIGFAGQFRINVPADAKGVYTISADTMDGDTSTPTGDRTVHVDQYTGKILADVKFTDYSIGGKAMAIGIALHQADMGWWNLVLNTVFCFAIIFMSISGVVMWWKRRPEGSLGAPLYPANNRIPIFIFATGAAVAVAFPLTGLGLALFAVIDFLLPKQFKEIGAKT